MPLDEVAMAKDELANLVSEFGKLNSDSLNELQTRLSFIDTFWRLLGWRTNDLSHVQVETRQDSKKPDYRFFRGRRTAFFVEAKRPSQNLNNPKHVFQAKSYAWSGGVPLVVLTDFAEFRPFRTLGKPRIEDDRKGLIKNYEMGCDAYADRAEELLNAFGREAVLGGSIVEVTKPTSRELKDTVDRDFLKLLSGWRSSLAHNIAVRNHFESEFVLAEAVQRILDRLVFIRILEDREVEDEGLLDRLVEKGSTDIYEHFVMLCRAIAPKYNGLIFNPHKPSEYLTIDDDVFRVIVKELLPDESPFRFDEIPVEVLGTIYERFLGEEIRLTSSGRAKIEQKSDDQKSTKSRKEGGVYYTPQYIVNHVVRGTVSELLARCNSPRDVARLRILDPACGSGSFLLGAMSALVEWHEQYFATNPLHATETQGKATYVLAYTDANGATRLTATMKTRLLKTCLFGIDVDRQATEVAQMSLYLKVLEGFANEPTTTLALHEAILPKLDANIICGNSLIAPDFLSDDFFGLDERDQRRLNPLDWKVAFPFISTTHGFDAVIGNPPYLYSAGQLYGDYFAQRYKLSEYQTDFYVYFIEQGARVLKKGGLLGMIVSDSWIKGKYFSKLRALLLSNMQLHTVTVFAYPPFEDATIECTVIVVEKVPPKRAFAVQRFQDPETLERINLLTPSDWRGKPHIDIHHSAENSKILAAIDSGSTPFKSFCRINRGIHAYRTDGYGRTKFGTGTQTKRDKEEKSYHSSRKVNKTYLPEIKGKHLYHFGYSWDGTWLSYGDWLAEARTPEFFMGPKLAIRKIIAPRLVCAYVEEPAALDQSIYVAIPGTNNPNLLFLLGVLGSAVGGWYLQKRFSIYDTLYPWFTTEQLAAFPIPAGAHTRHLEPHVAALTESLIEQQRELHSAQSEAEHKHRRSYVKQLLEKLDLLVFDCYQLSSEQRQVIRGGADL